MNTTRNTLLAAATLALAACENPADKTESAKVADAVSIGSTTAAPTGSVTYSFAPESEIRFVGSKVTGSHEGGFKSFTGSFALTKGQLAGTGQKITIDMNSIWSDNEKLTGHLKNKDFFHVEKYPSAQFELTQVAEDAATGIYQVSGNLTLMETTRNITFPARVTRNGTSADIHARFDINRKDFGVVYAGMPDDLIRNEVVIELKLKAVPNG